MKRMSVFLVVLLLIVCGNTVSAEPFFGGEKDVGFAKDLWQVLKQHRLVGKDYIRSMPYEGTRPHGVVLDTMDTTITVNGVTGLVIIKKNYGGGDLAVDDVADNPEKYLKAVTVMFKRESGYDPENKDWFWAKYLPDGRLDVNPAKVPLAGRVIKGNSKGGCIACHKNADGDMIFLFDR